MNTDDIANALFTTLRLIKIQIVHCTEKINVLKHENEELRTTVFHLKEQVQQQTTDLRLLQQDFDLYKEKNEKLKIKVKKIESSEKEKINVEFIFPTLRTLAFDSFINKDLPTNVLHYINQCKHIRVSHCYLLHVNTKSIMQVVILNLMPIDIRHSHAGYFKQLRGILKENMQKVYGKGFDFGEKFTYITPLQVYKSARIFVQDFCFNDKGEFILHSKKKSSKIPEQALIIENEIWLQAEIIGLCEIAQRYSS